MVVVEYLYEDMKKLVNLPLEKVIDGLNNLGAPSEYKEDIKKIITELTPNRPDWYSMEGLARSLRAYYRKEIGEYKTRKSDYVVVVDPSVGKVRPFTVCAVVKGLEFNDQRIRDMVLLQEKLIGTMGRKVKKFGLGVYPLNAIKFPVRYTTMKPDVIRYVPLGYDREMTADEILKVHKKGQQYGYLLRNQSRYPVFIDADKKIMCLIPIVNSVETGKVDEETGEIFVEVTGEDLGLCKTALNILVCTFADMGGEIYEVKMKYGKSFSSPDLNTRKMKLDIGRVNKVLGTELKDKDVQELLIRMGYCYAKGIVEIPPYRADIIGEIDIIEDVAIAYGYNSFTPTLPDFFHQGGFDKKYDKFDGVLRGMGFIEVKTFVLTNKGKLAKLNYRGKILEVTNPASEEYSVLRPNLIGDFLDIFANNKMKKLPQNNYEIGLSYLDKTETRLIFGSMDKKIEFSDFRGYLQTLMDEVGKKFSLKKRKTDLFEEEYGCSILSGDREIGIFGKVPKNVLERLGMECDIYICQLDL